MPEPLLPPSNGPLVKPRQIKKRPDWVMYVIASTCILVGLGIMWFGFIYIRPMLLDRKQQQTENFQGQVFSGTVRNVHNEEEKAFKVLAPEGAWTMDKELRNGLGAILAMRQTDGDAWVAIYVRDYGLQKPRDAELVNVGMERLKQLFGDSLETADKTRPASLAGDAGQSLEFRGRIKNMPNRGEMTMIAHQGLGYWIFVGAPKLEEAQNALSQMQADGLGFQFNTNRRNWREQPPPQELFGGKKIPLTVSGPEGSWEKFPAFDQDENADLFLLGRYLREKDNRKNATVLVLGFKGQADLKEAAKFAREYVVNEKTKGSKDFSVVTASDNGPELGEVGQVGNKPGRIIEMKMLLENDPKRYIVLAVINEDERMIAIVCECVWENRQIWQQEFRDLLSTVKVKK